MGRARRWASVALAGFVAACLSAAGPGSARAAQQVGDWNVGGHVEAGGMYNFGERSSSKFNQYRDMDNGFLGEIDLYGEKKDSPYFFELRGKNPTRDDQWYDGAFGRYGMFQLDLSWNRTPHVLSNNAATIYQLNGDTFSLPSTLRTNIQQVFTGTGGQPAPTSAAGRANISATINGLLRPTELGFNTDVGKAGIKYTPLEFLRFDFEYANIRREGTRPVSSQMAGSTSGPLHELAIPIENYTNEFKFGAEYARPNWGLQFNYIGSIFTNEFTGYSWDNPNVATSTAGASARDRFSAAPDNTANTLSLTGTAALPFRTRVNGTFAYTMLRQDQTFEYNTGNTAIATRRNTDTAGNDSADAQANLVLGNIVVTSRPINSLTATARFRFFEYQNDMPSHTFSNAFVSGGTGSVVAQTKNERYKKLNGGFDLGWRPIRMLSLKAGYEYEHWERADYAEFGDTGPTHPFFQNTENIGKFAADVTPVDWFLGRVTYTYGDRTISGYNFTPATELPQSIKYNYAPRIRNKVDALFQFTPWETFTPSFNVGYAVDDYHENQFGMTKADYLSAGVDLDWSPLRWLTLSADYTYEQYNYEMTSRYLVGGTFPGFPFNTWASKSKDEFHNVGINAVFDVIPKKFDITLGYAITLGYTTIQNSNPSFNVGGTTTVPSARAYPWDKVYNVFQVAKIIAKYRLTEQLSVRGGFAYERYTERDWARDPMQPFLGNYDSDRPANQPGFAFNTQAVQSVWLGATQPNSESYTVAGFVRYAF